MKIIMVLILLFVLGILVGIASVKSEYDIKKIPYQTEIKYSSFDLVVNETLTVKVNLIFELNTAFVEVIRESSSSSSSSSNNKNQNDIRFKRDLVLFEHMPLTFPTIDEVVENFRRELIRKEEDIGGIIDSPAVICRYFKLKYLRSIVNIRCNYHSDFENKTLRIFCHHYNAVSNTNERNLIEKNYFFERDFTNDEGDDYYDKANPTNLQLERHIGTYNINDYQQVLHMNIQ